MAMKSMNLDEGQAILMNLGVAVANILGTLFLHRVAWHWYVRPMFRTRSLGWKGSFSLGVLISLIKFCMVDWSNLPKREKRDALAELETNITKLLSTLIYILILWVWHLIAPITYEDK